MSNFKKAVAVFFAAAVTLSLAGCAESSYIGTAGDSSIRNGVYLSYMLDSYNEAQSLIPADDSESTDVSDDVSASESTTSETVSATEAPAETKAAETTAAETKSQEQIDKEFFAKSIDGKPVSEWIVEKTKERLAEYGAVEKMFKDMGLSFSSVQKKSINENVKTVWENEYYAGYWPFESIYGEGITTQGKYYESLGISEQSYKEIVTNNAKRSVIFDAIYGEGGSAAVSEDEINAYYLENYAKVNMIQVDFEEDGENMPEGTGKEVSKTLADLYVERLNGGEKFGSVYEEYQDYVAKQNSDGTEEETVAEEETVKADEEYDQIIAKSSTAYGTDFIDKLFKMAYNKVELIEGDNAYYVVIRKDASGDSESVETYKSDILHGLKDEEFTKTVDDTAASIEVKLDESLTKKYSPEKIKK